MTKHVRCTLSVFLLTGCAASTAPAPLSVSPADAGKRAVGEHGAVASANPLASEAGLAILQAGGNAVDAAVATAFAIGVVEPQMSGLGGGGAMLVWRADERQAAYLDFYPMQPVERFRGRTGYDDDGDLRIVGVPGNVAGLLAAHERFGRLPREQVMAPAIRLAEHGFPVGQILASFIESDSAKLARFDEGFARMWPARRPLHVGAVLRNPDLGAALRHIAQDGADAFYRGPLTRNVVRVMNEGGHPVRIDDFAAYEPIWKQPLCIEYRGRMVLSAPPPQTGAQVLHTLQMLEHFRLDTLGLPTRDARAFDVLTSALRVGMADNRGENDDPRWDEVHPEGRITSGFAAERVALVGKGAAGDTIETKGADEWAAEGKAGAEAEPACRSWLDSGAATAAGLSLSHARDASASPAEGKAPQTVLAPRHASDDVGDDDRTEAGSKADGGETTHISVTDASGNAVALTQTNSTTFGSGAWVHGFFLNDSGYIFRSDSALADAPARWRTRTSTIAPTLVLDDEGVELVIGAPGGGRIPTEIVQTMVYLLDYGMDPLDAVRMPRIYPSPVSRRVQLEHGFAGAVLRAARELGYDPVPPRPGYARLYLVMRRDGRWVAVADPRHDGEARAY